MEMAVQFQYPENGWSDELNTRKRSRDHANMLTKGLEAIGEDPIHHPVQDMAQRLAGDIVQGPWSKAELDRRIKIIQMGLQQRGLVWDAKKGGYVDLEAQVIPLKGK